MVLEGIPSIISNNLTDLSKSVCGLIFLKHDLALLHNNKCTGVKEDHGILLLTTDCWMFNYLSHDTVQQ